MAKKLLGDVLKAAREKRGLTLREVEKQTGIRNAHVSQLENHVIKKPEPSMLYPLAEFYGLDYFHLLELAGWGEAGSGREKQRVSVAMRTMGELSAGEQKQVLAFITELKSKKDEDD
jgi:HTH-type transcriptional regulator, competence development regulator